MTNKRSAFDQLTNHRQGNFESLTLWARSGLGLRRYTSDHLDSMTTMQTENQDLKKKLKEMEVRVVLFQILFEK